jgi:hypothetical protein
MLAIQAAKKSSREQREKRWNEYTTHNANVAVADDDPWPGENSQGSQTSTTDDSSDQYDSDEQVDLAYYTEHDHVDEDEGDASNEADDYLTYSNVEDLLQNNQRPQAVEPLTIVQDKVPHAAESLTTAQDRKPPAAFTAEPVSPMQLPSDKPLVGTPTGEECTTSGARIPVSAPLESVTVSVSASPALATNPIATVDSSESSIIALEQVESDTAAVSLPAQQPVADIGFTPVETI